MERGYGEDLLMKRKILTFIMMFIMISLLGSLTGMTNAYAQETGAGSDTSIQPGDGTNTTTTDTQTNPLVTVNSIVIRQLPSKITYRKGENLNFSDMIVDANYSDGTSAAVTDYQISGYDSSILGTQTVTISYQGLTASLSITVLPSKVMNVTCTSHDMSSFTLSWDPILSAVRYEIYSYDAITGGYTLATTASGNSVTLNYPPATSQSFQICAVEVVNGTEYKSDYSDTFTAATSPSAVTGLSATANTNSSITLTWDQVSGATGYIIYRSSEKSSEFTLCNTTNTNTYQDLNLSSGVAYQYKVCAFTYDKQYYGDSSAALDTSTAPAISLVKCKAGEDKVKIFYKKVNGASFYDIYMADSSSNYTLLTSRIGWYKNYFVADGLTTGETYSFYVIARKEYNGTSYQGDASDAISVDVVPVEPTSTYAKIFATKNDFMNSYAYTKIDFFRKYVQFSKSYVIPGLATTNVDGFSSTTMCPQGITFTENYLLQTAYDLSGEENSVIYVMDKNSRELLTTLVLPSQTHAGGIGYDGTNIWVPTGKKVSSIPVTDIDEAVASGNAYVKVSYLTTCSINNVGSYITYYDNKLWVGTYDELKQTYMYSYDIYDKDSNPTLEQVDAIYMPTRVQGAAFTSQGTLILSRSCQLYKGLRGYMRQLDVYRPDFANENNGIILLGDVGNTVEMPSMNEDIAIDGAYLYVNFESAAFDKASYKMDRICAFKLSSITKKTK
jgi:Fibronectin type III domain./Bacterial Ig-like domain (group 3).